MPYKQKVIETPLMVRVLQYKKQVPSDFEQKRETYEKRLEGTKTKKSLTRARNNLADLIQCNIKPYSKFITLTTQENIKDRNKFIKKFEAFRRAFKRKYGYSIKYSAVMETQKRGAWHIHMVAYNLTQKIDIPELDRLWQRVAGKGHVDVKVVDSYVNMHKYLIKYLTKDEVEHNKKAVLSSKGLERPTIITSYQEVNYQDLWGKPNYETSWTLYHGNLKNDIDECVRTGKSFVAYYKKRFNECEMFEWHK